MPKVYNMHRPYPIGAVYIGRPSKYGNPFSHLDGTLAQFKVRTRKEAIEQFELWFLAQPKLVEEARRELAGKDLVCWCVPKPCHGHVLIRIVNSLDTNLNPAQLLLEL